jgi:hypothetical protein
VSSDPGASIDPKTAEAAPLQKRPRKLLPHMVDETDFFKTQIADTVSAELGATAIFTFAFIDGQVLRINCRRRCAVVA